MNPAKFPAFAVWTAACFGALPARAGEAANPTSFCNPIDLSYRFALQAPSRREAADPVIVWWDNKYWLFASKSGGYWYSTDFARWQFVAPTGLPLENYAPAVEIINGELHFTAGGAPGMYTSPDPLAGNWAKTATMQAYDDPAVFADTDGRVYMYSGTSATDPIKGVELDASTFAQLGAPQSFISADPIRRGWELKKLEATDAEILAGTGKPFLEGAWMTKHNGIYYLQYAAPGTERKWYGDGVYTSNSPLGPFTYQLYSPFSLKATGFIGGTGHGNTFQDPSGNYWHSTCALIGAKHSFERRVAVFPSGFVPNSSGPDQMLCNTYLGDYPQYLPGQASDPLANNLRGWMLLSYKKASTASSTLPSTDPLKPNLYTTSQAFDEDVATWWSAQTGNSGEWLAVDLGKPCEIRAIQTNFADQDSTLQGHLNDAYRYLIEVSNDGTNWTTCLSRAANTRNSPHDYAELDAPLTARHVRITNLYTPAGMKFSISGFRLFGHGLGVSPQSVTGIAAERLPDRRQAKVRWNPVAGADFYIVRYGIEPDRLFLNAQVEGTTTMIRGLNTEATYYFAVDAINDSGITKDTAAVLPANINTLDRTGWLASASSSSTVDLPAHAIDGNAATRWATGTKQTPGQWFQVDMASPFTVHSINQRNSVGDHPRGYEIYLSLDGANWEAPVATGTATAATTLHEIHPRTARYIRMVQTGSTTGNWWSILEWDVAGAPAQMMSRAGWTAAASSGTNPSHALDGNPATQWTTSANQTPGQWFQIDLGALRRFHQLVLDAGTPGHHPRGYQIQVSDDGITWGHPIATGTGANPVTTISFPEQSGRYIRITQTASVAVPWSIREIHLYSSSQAQPVVPGPLAGSAANGSVVLHWPAASGATGYKIKRSTKSGGPYIVVGQPTGTTFTQSGLTNGLTYHYVICASNAHGDSINSNQISLTPYGVPALPVDVLGTSGDQLASLGWPAVPGATSYKVQRAAARTGPFTTVATVANAGHQDTGLTNGGIYYYVIRASNAAGDSGHSTPICVMPGLVPSPWQVTNIDVATGGGAHFSSGTYTLQATGREVGGAGSADQLLFVHQSASGDCSITVKLASGENTNAWAKWGIMIRENLNGGSINAAVLATPTNGIHFQHRPATAAATLATSTATGVTPPRWLKLTRSGNTFTGYQSSDGATWIQMGTPRNVAMAANVRVGFFGSSHVTDRWGESTFTDVIVSP